MIETIVVVGIVGTVAVMAVRSFYRTFTVKETGCCCGCANRTCGQAEKEASQVKPVIST